MAVDLEFVDVRRHPQQQRVAGREEVVRRDVAVGLSSGVIVRTAFLAVAVQVRSVRVGKPQAWVRQHCADLLVCERVCERHQIPVVVELVAEAEHTEVLARDLNVAQMRRKGPRQWLEGQQVVRADRDHFGQAHAAVAGDVDRNKCCRRCERQQKGQQQDFAEVHDASIATPPRIKKFYCAKRGEGVHFGAGNTFTV